MKFTSFAKGSALKGAGAVALTVALGAGLTGCGGGGLGGGDVAATVNGQQIMEQTVTDYVADFRASSGLDTDEAWGEWMVANGYTPETVREEVIDYYVNQDLYDQAASEYNVTVEQADIDEALSQTKSMFESDEAFQEALEASQMTEEDYINDVIRPNLLQTKLAEAVAAADEGDGTDDTLSQAQAMAEQLNGAKRSSHILLTAEGEETDEDVAARAQALLDQINNGEISFEDAATQYSQDSGSAASGGDVNWDKLGTGFVTEYQEALDGLNKDDIVAAPVKSEYGYHIIKCTDVFTLPEGGITSVDQLPAEFQETLSYMEQSSATQNFATWFEEYRGNATIEVNPMPEGLPYDIDLTPYEEAAAADQATPEGDTSVDAAQDEAAAADADAAAADAQAADAAADEAAGDTAAADEAAGAAADDQAAADGAAADAAADDAAADQAGDAAGEAAGDQAE